MVRRLAISSALIALATPGFTQDTRPVADIVITGLVRTNDESARLVIRNAGVREGQPFSNDAFTKARAALREQMVGSPTRRSTVAGIIAGHHGSALPGHVAPQSWQCCS